MNIQFELTEEDFDTNKQTIMQNVLKISHDELEESLVKIFKASAEEYLAMFLEGGMPNRADESKQDRLMFLIKNYFVTLLPTESQISTIFQLTQSQSKTLLKNTISRFRHNLNDVLLHTMIDVLEQAEESEDKFLVVINSDLIKDELNMLITQNEPRYTPIVKRRGSAGQYEISRDSFTLLENQLEI